MTISWDGLGDYKTYRVISPRGVEGVMVSKADQDDESVPHVVNWQDGFSGWVRASGEIYTGPDEDKEVTILGELKLPSQLTAEDLDGMVFKTKDGGAVLFCGESAAVWQKGRLSGWSWPGFDEPPCWWKTNSDGRDEDADGQQAAYLIHVEQQKNPPIEIVWEIALDNNGLPAHSACRVRGDFWQLWHRDGNAANPIGMYLNRQFFADSNGFGDSESKMRNHYKTEK